MTDKTATNENPNDKLPTSPLQLRITALIDEVFPELKEAREAHTSLIESLTSRVVYDHPHFGGDSIMELVLRMRADHMAAEHMKYEGMLSKQKFENLTERVESLARAKDAADIKNGLLMREQAAHRVLFSDLLDAISKRELVGVQNLTDWEGLADKIRVVLRREPLKQ